MKHLMSKIISLDWPAIRHAIRRIITLTVLSKESTAKEDYPHGRNHWHTDRANFCSPRMLITHAVTFPRLLDCLAGKYIFAISTHGQTHTGECETDYPFHRSDIYFPRVCNIPQSGHTLIPITIYQPNISSDFIKYSWTLYIYIPYKLYFDNFICKYNIDIIQ